MNAILTPPKPGGPARAGQLVLFDAAHGQPNWAQTGYTSREMHTNFAGVAQALRQLGCTCAAATEKPLARFLAGTRLLVVPPPTSRYDGRKECWAPQPGSLFSAAEIQDILGFVQAGGRLLACAYRFGDSFTHTNLHDLLSPLGCILNDDAVIDVTTLRTVHPLRTGFETPADLLPLAWFRPGIQRVCWRPMATFSILPGATAQPIALSPGGCCIAFDRTHRQIEFVSRPIAVAGLHHRGRFVLLGGPHAIETGTFGLLGEADNARFLQNILNWLLEDDPAALESLRLTLTQPMHWRPAGLMAGGRGFSSLAGGRSDQQTIASVERCFRKTGVLRALGRAKWMP